MTKNIWMKASLNLRFKLMRGSWDFCADTPEMQSEEYGRKVWSRWNEGRDQFHGVLHRICRKSLAGWNDLAKFQHGWLKHSLPSLHRRRKQINSKCECLRNQRILEHLQKFWNSKERGKLQSRMSNLGEGVCQSFNTPSRTLSSMLEMHQPQKLKVFQLKSNG